MIWHVCHAAHYSNSRDGVIFETSIYINVVNINSDETEQSLYPMSLDWPRLPSPPASGVCNTFSLEQQLLYSLQTKKKNSKPIIVSSSTLERAKCAWTRWLAPFSYHVDILFRARNVRQSWRTVLSAERTSEAPSDLSSTSDVAQIPDTVTTSDAVIDPWVVIQYYQNSSVTRNGIFNGLSPRTHPKLCNMTVRISIPDRQSCICGTSLPDAHLCCCRMTLRTHRFQLKSNHQ